MAVPLAEPLAHYLTTLSAGTKSGASLFPGMAALVKAGGTGTLSRLFSELLAGIGLATKKDHKGKMGDTPGGKPREGVLPMSAKIEAVKRKRGNGYVCLGSSLCLR